MIIRNSIILTRDEIETDLKNVAIDIFPDALLKREFNYGYFAQFFNLHTLTFDDLTCLWCERCVDQMERIFNEYPKVDDILGADINHEGEVTKYWLADRAGARMELNTKN